MPEILLTTSGILYAGSWGGFLANHTGFRPGASRLATTLLLAAAIVHAFALGLRFIALGIPPVTSGFEGLSLVSLLIAGIFLILRRRHPIDALGTFVAPLVFVHLSTSLLFAHGTDAVPEALRSVYFYVHIAPAFLGDAFLAMAAVGSIAYLLQEQKLRAKVFPAVNGALPNLTLADHLAYRMTTLGFLFMSLGIVSGMFYSKQQWQSYWSWDPRQVWSLITWFAYALMLHARFTSGWRGRRWAWLTVAAFGLVVGSAVILDAFKMGRHGGDYDAHPRAQELP